MTKCNIKILFKFGELQNKFMSVKISCQGVQSTIEPSDNNAVWHSQDITLPAKLELEFLGKNNMCDTEIDVDGKIIKDKHVLIKEILLDNIAVEPLYLKRYLLLQHQTGVSHSNYIGFNGRMIIDLPMPNVFLQIMDWKRLGEF